MAKPKLIIVKLRNSVPVDDIEKAIAPFVLISGLLKIERMFPDNSNTTLAHWLEIEIEPTAAEQIITTLKQNPNIEHAYEPPRRHMLT